MNPVQEAYTAAKQWLKASESLLQNEERAYIRRHVIKNQDGSTPASLEDLDDPERALNFMGDFYDCVLSPETNDELSHSREALKVAENSLIAWGLSVIPQREADLLSEGIAKYAAYRNKALQLFMELTDDGGRA